MTTSNNTLSYSDLSDIRDAVPTLDLLAIRSLQRAGFQIIRKQDIGSEQPTQQNSSWCDVGEKIHSAA